MKYFVISYCLNPHFRVIHLTCNVMQSQENLGVGKPWHVFPLESKKKKEIWIFKHDCNVTLAVVFFSFPFTFLNNCFKFHYVMFSHMWSNYSGFPSCKCHVLMGHLSKVATLYQLWTIVKKSIVKGDKKWPRQVRPERFEVFCHSFAYILGNWGRMHQKIRISNTSTQAHLIRGDI